MLWGRNNFNLRFSSFGKDAPKNYMSEEKSVNDALC